MGQLNWLYKNTPYSLSLLKKNKILLSYSWRQFECLLFLKVWQTTKPRAWTGQEWLVHPILAFRQLFLNKSMVFHSDTTLVPEGICFLERKKDKGLPASQKCTTHRDREGKELWASFHWHTRSIWLWSVQVKPFVVSFPLPGSSPTSKFLLFIYFF